MGDIPIPAGLAYSYRLLEAWGDVVNLSELYRYNYMMGQTDKEIQSKLISKLTMLWGELQPKVAPRKDFGTLPEEFMRFERYYIEPMLLTQQPNAEDIFKLQRILRESLEKLRITVYEGG